jgi:transposase-like protein
MLCFKDREALLAFNDFPAEHWIHIRAHNPIESTVATVSEGIEEQQRVPTIERHAASPSVQLACTRFDNSSRASPGRWTNIDLISVSGSTWTEL